MIEAEIMIRRIIRESLFEIGFTFEHERPRLHCISAMVTICADNLVQSHKTQAISRLVSMANEVKGPTGLSVMAASHVTELSQSIMKIRSSNAKARGAQKYLDNTVENANIILQQSKRVDELAESFKTISLDQATYDRRVFVLPGYLHFITLSCATM